METIINESDLSELKKVHQFVRNDEIDEMNKSDWKTRMARRYYDKLYKEYAIIDLSRYKEGQFGLRWRTEDEIINGKGQSICAGRKCTDITDLKSFEMPFQYQENGVTKCELVKIRVCKACAKKISFRDLKRKSSSDGDDSSAILSKKSKT